MPRLSRAYFPNAEQDDSGHYVFMFTRDVYTGIMPFRNGGSYPFTVTLTRKNQNLEKQLKEFLGIGMYGSKWQLDETIWDAVEALSQYLATSGEAYLEIVHGDNKATAGIGNKKLEFLPHGKIIRVFGNYIQLVPIKNWERGEKKFYVIPSNRIWHVKLPRKLGTPRQHHKMLKRLSVLSDPMPEFALKDGDMGSSAKYDFMIHHHNKDIAVELATSGWGSIRSLGQIKGTTEYYYIVNRLQATCSQALLREHITHQINDLLARLGVKNSLKVEGLKMSADIKDTIKRLEKGEIGFGEAMGAIKD